MSTTKPVIGMVQGDPAGIGSELMIKLLADQDVRQRADIVVIGAPSVFERGEGIAGSRIERQHTSAFDPACVQSAALQHIDLQIDNIKEVPLAQVSAAGGQSSLKGLELAFELSSKKCIDGVCFMPLNKESMHLGGNPYMDESVLRVTISVLKPGPVNLTSPRACGTAGSHLTLQ